MADYVSPPDSLHKLVKDPTTGHIMWYCNGVPVLFLDINSRHFVKAVAPLGAGLPLDSGNFVLVD